MANDRLGPEFDAFVASRGTALLRTAVLLVGGHRRHLLWVRERLARSGCFRSRRRW